MIPLALFEAAQLWALGGRRCVDVQINNQSNDPEYKIWAYSYEQGEGVHVTTESDLPTEDELKSIKRAGAEAILSELN